MEDLYKLAKDGTGTGKWLEVQKLAIAENAASDKLLTEKVLEAQHTSVRLPIIRTAINDCAVRSNGKVVKVKKDEVVICDIVRNLLACSFLFHADGINNRTRQKKNTPTLSISRKATI